jgi:hypothetical protein
MSLPRQSPPVARTAKGGGVTPRRNGVEPAEDGRGPKVSWKCTTFQADQDDPTKIESVLSYNIPGATSGWIVVDNPCVPKP